MRLKEYFAFTKVIQELKEGDFINDKLEKELLTCIMIDNTITDNTNNTVLVNNTSRTDTEQ